MKTPDRFITNPALRKIGLAVFATALIAGCATTPPPVEQMAVSRAAVASANSSGAVDFAPVQLKSAMDKMTFAERAMVEEKYDLALALAEEAQVEAQLAASMARSAKAQKAAEAIQEDSRILRKELDRKTK